MPISKDKEIRWLLFTSFLIRMMMSDGWRLSMIITTEVTCRLSSLECNTRLTLLSNNWAKIRLINSQSLKWPFYTDGGIRQMKLKETRWKPCMPMDKSSSWMEDGACQTKLPLTMKMSLIKWRSDTDGWRKHLERFRLQPGTLTLLGISLHQHRCSARWECSLFSFLVLTTKTRTSDCRTRRWKCCGVQTNTTRTNQHTFSLTSITTTTAHHQDSASIFDAMINPLKTILSLAITTCPIRPIS